MADPTMDLQKLKAVRDWAEDLVDELNRSDVLPCKNTDRLGDCISRQRRYLVEEMKPKKMCTRCQTRWYAMMVVKGLSHVHEAKTNRAVEAAPDFS